MKLAFGFLITDEINQEDKWYNFFIESSLKYDIIIHSKNEPILKKLNKLTKNIYVNEVYTEWGKLQKVQNFLLEKSKKLNCDKLIILSNSCIPIKNINYIFDYLSNDKSYIKHDKPWWPLNTRGYIDQNYIMGNHQWCIIDKKHYDVLLNDNEREYFENIILFPEESYFSTILNKNGLLKDVENIQTTFVDWERSPNGRSPYLFSNYNQFDHNIIKKIKLDENILFIRKIDKKLNISEYDI
jgi:hypothetical protein